MPAHAARVRGQEDAGGGLVLVTVEPSDEVRASYVLPGQYVSVRAGHVGKAPAGFFVLASDVGARNWQLLIRPGGAAADGILAVRVGGRLETTRAQGRGFPCDEARGRSLLLAATGSGIAAVRPVVSRRLHDHDAHRTEVLLGVRTRADLPLSEELAAWREKGVRVTVCLSRETVSAEEARGFAGGYVQDVARASTALQHQGGMIFAAGVKGMIEGIRRLARDLGIAEADVRTNY